MCGIAGIFNNNASVDHRHIKTMCDILCHRGPDDEGFIGVNTAEHTVRPLFGPQSQAAGEKIETYYEKADLFLGHRRLSILDVSAAGHQPMCDNDGNVWITYNGEIYNYIELKEELLNKGYIFHTATDTEVLLYSYLEWGMDCLNKFNGMWAFVIYDKRKDLLWGARDRFGVKPLYYYKKNGYFVFASEMKAILGLPFIQKEINETAAYEYLVLCSNDPIESFLSGIEELKPSEAFMVDLRRPGFSTWKYYQLECNNVWESFIDERAGAINEQVKDMVFGAIRMRLQSDVPVGSCLSGGIDSSSIVCVINDYLKKEAIGSVGVRQKVFTACYDDTYIDESKWAKMVVDNTNTDWHRTFPTSRSLHEDLDDLIYSQDIPFGSTSIYAQYRVMRLAHDHGIKVLLDGQGGDELFTGYTHYYVNYFLDLIKNGEFKLLAHELRYRQNTPVAHSLYRLMLSGAIKKPVYDRLPALLKYYYHRILKPVTRYLGNEFAGRNRMHDLDQQKTSWLSLNEMLSFMMKKNLPELLRYEDRNSMRFSIESRTPFADDIKLINYLFTVPSVYKIHDGWTKYLLRRAVSAVVPAAIIKRTDKVGFSTPEYYWLKESGDELINSMWSEGLDYFIDYKRISRDWKSLLMGRQKSGITSLWRYINFALWKKRFRL
jgi:asparagine synthase (glutamine-hydrolysing)